MNNEGKLVTTQIKVRSQRNKYSEILNARELYFTWTSEGVDLEFHLGNNLDLHFVNAFNLSGKCTFTYSLMLFYTILGDLKVIY